MAVGDFKIKLDIVKYTFHGIQNSAYRFSRTIENTRFRT